MIYCDLVNMEYSKDIELFSKTLNFNKIFFKEDIKKLGIEIELDYEKKRKLIEENKIKILLNPHLINIKDNLHYRSSGLDQVLCKIMNKNEISLGITLNALNNYIEIGRVMQNIRLCRKYKVKILVFSFAENKYDIKSRIDIESLLKTLGMDGKQIKEAFNLKL